MPSNPQTILHSLEQTSPRELATILAALRSWQCNAGDKHDFEHFADCTPLDSDEIDALCERLNFASMLIPQIVISVQGGLVQDVYCSTSAEVALVDWVVDSHDDHPGIVCIHLRPAHCSHLRRSPCRKAADGNRWKRCRAGDRHCGLGMTLETPPPDRAGTRMPKFNVYLYPAMVLHVCGIEADDPTQAITKAIQLAEADYLDANGNSRSRLVYADEVVRYVVDPVVDGEPDYHKSETFLDAAHLAGDQRDKESGFPVFESG